MSFSPISQSLPQAPQRPQVAANRPLGTPAKRAPAAGASGGAKPKPATFFAPGYQNLDGETLGILLHVLRDAMATQLYLLIRSHCIFTTGEFLGSYARLMELCTPPIPERGQRRLGPTMKVVRRCIDDLVRHGLMVRSETNKEAGQLRLWLTPPKNLPTSIRKEGRV